MWVFVGSHGVREYVRRSHCILDSEIDANAAQRRHGMGRIANCETTRSIPSGQPIPGNGQKLHVIPATDAFCRFGKVRIGVGDFVMEMGQALPLHAVRAAFGKYISALPIVVPIDLPENAPCLKNTHSLISDFWLFREEIGRASCRERVCQYV